MNRLQQQETSEHDPGTPDTVVDPRRLTGRMAYREDRENPHPPTKKANLTAWWLGWYDEQLKRFYGRA